MRNAACDGTTPKICSVVGAGHYSLAASAGGSLLYSIAEPVCKGIIISRNANWADILNSTAKQNHNCGSEFTHMYVCRSPEVNAPTWMLALDNIIITIIVSGLLLF